MIHEEELLDAIAECQGTRNPNANTCLKLASYYTILDHLRKKEKEEVNVMQSYSYAKGPSYSSDTEFWKAASLVDDDELMKIIDELMSTLQIVNPRLYMSVIRKLESSK